MKRVLVFGIFDGLHPGHLNFFKQAKKIGNFLVVAVGRPSISQKLKNKKPKYSLRERINFVQEVPEVDKAIAGDKGLGTYGVIMREQPDIICLGYDQKKLHKNLKKWIGKNNLKIKLEVLKSYKSSRYHTAIIRRGSDEGSRY